MAFALTTKRRPAAAQQKSPARAGKTTAAFSLMTDTCARPHPLNRSPAFQAKLAVSEPGDVYEKEADRVAERIMRMPEPALQRVCSAGGGSTCPECAGEQDGVVQRKPEGSLSGAGPVPDRFLQDLGPGRSLDRPARAFFEPRFGTDFSQVRVHTDGRAAESAGAVNALAYTFGRDIVFGAGQYAPETGSGKRVMAHELAHVLQQGAGTQPLRLARLTQKEREENLRSPKYSGKPRLEKAFDDNPSMTIGESGEAVRLVQEGLVADGFEMPASTTPAGELDGAFGEETFRVVKQFQTKHGLDVDGIVGRQTMGRLDQLARTAPCVFPVGVFNGPSHEPVDTETHAGMLIDITVLPSTGRPGDLQGVEVSEQVTPSFDHTGSLADVPPIISRASGFQSATDFINDQHVIRKDFVIDRALNHGGDGSLSIHQLDVFKHPACGVAAATVVPASGHRIDMIITAGAGGTIELTTRKSAENCTVNGFTTTAGPSLTHSDTVAVQSAGAIAQCPPDPTAFEVTSEQLFANPKFDFDFSGGNRPSLSTRAPLTPFHWNATVKTLQPVPSCFEVGFLQTLRSSFQAAVYSSETRGQERLCLVIVPTPIRDAKPGQREPWYENPSRLGTNCFPEVVLPPGISGNLDETSVVMRDNPFSKWCIFLEPAAENTASDCGSSDAAFRLNTLVEALAFDAWLVLRPLGASDLDCFTFLRHASWFKSVEIVVAPTGTLGFLKRDLGLTVFEHGDGVGTDRPEFGSQTPAEAAKRVCITSSL